MFGGFGTFDTYFAAAATQKLKLSERFVHKMLGVNHSLLLYCISQITSMTELASSTDTEAAPYNQVPTCPTLQILLFSVEKFPEEVRNSVLKILFHLEKIKHTFLFKI